MHSRVERLIGHNGTETRPILLREAAVRESSTMGASLMEQHRAWKKVSARKALLLKNAYESNCSYVDGI